MQTLISLCLLLLSTLTPAGNANAIAGITSDKPRMPIESLLPVSSYNFHPSNTGLMRKPVMNNNLAIAYQVNSLLIIEKERSFFIGSSSLMVSLENAARFHNLFPALQ